MNFLKKYYHKFFFKQYTIGITEGSLEEIIRQKKANFAFKWFAPGHYNTSFADPFAFTSSNGKINILAEKFTTGELDGDICLLTYDATQSFSAPKVIYHGSNHFSYPAVYIENNTTNVVLVNGLTGPLLSYQFNDDQQKLVNEKVICNLPLVDATVLQHNNKYWLFGNLLEEGKSNKLYIYFADNFAGPYKAHAANPVKNDLDGSRSAGSFIKVDDCIYRPSQNCRNFYGESITIQKIIKLTETEFEEEAYFTIEANKKEEFGFGIHTINAAGNYIIVDGQKGHFQPFLQIYRAIKRLFSQNKNKLSCAVCYLHNFNFEDYMVA